MWHGAKLGSSQWKQFPPLNQFLSNYEEPKGIDETAIKARLQAYQGQKGE